MIGKVITKIEAQSGCSTEYHNCKNKDPENLNSWKMSISHDENSLRGTV